MPNRYAFAPLQRGWWQPVRSISVRRFDALWWSQRREALETVKRSLHGGGYEVS